MHSIGDWWEASPDSDFMRMAERAIQREWGAQPLLVREGGTMPVASSLQKILGAPALLLPMGQVSSWGGCIWWDFKSCRWPNH